jgi:ABC-type protease/lipase transport system fused ATPase/permease subunit
MGITSVIVAHRPNLVNNTDKIAILQDGALKEFGATRQILGKYVAPSISEAGA